MHIHLPTNPLENVFRDKKVALVIRSLAISTLVVFVIETGLMLVFERVVVLPEPVVTILDGLILVACLFPLNYYFVIRPMVNQIEEHYQTNVELIKTNEILERFFSISDILIAYLDPNFNFIRVNQAYAAADGKRPEDFPGKNHFVLYPHSENQRIFETVIRTGKPYQVAEKPFAYAASPERGISYWDWSLMPVKNIQGQVIGLIFVLTDVTARKQAQLALAESERRFRAVFNQTFQHAALLDPTGRILVVNQTALDFTGSDEHQLQETPLWQAAWWDAPAETAGQIYAAVQQARAGKTAHCESRVKSPSGPPAIMDISMKPLLDEAGETVLLIYEARDITRHILDEEALLRSEEEIKRLYQAEKHAHQLAETLRSAGADLSGSLNSRTVLERMLGHLLKVVAYHSAHIFRFEDEDHLAVQMARGEEQWNTGGRLLGERFDISELPFLQPLLKERRILSIPDTTQRPDIPIFTDNGMVRSWVGIPLLAGDQVIGLCTLEHASSNFFNDELVRWADALVTQAAVAIQNAWLFEQVRDNRERLQALSRRLVEVQEMERRYIAQELHDDAGQALASLMVGLRVLERNAGDPQAVTASCTELRQIADGVLENLHRLSIDLRPATLDHLGLVAALRQRAEAISDQHDLAVQFETVGEINRLSIEMETAIYRIAQEALTNVVWHAQATRVDILLERRNEDLILVVEDNGVGFDPQNAKTGQLGLLGMRERADMLGGKLTIESAPGQGTTIFLEVPCPSAS